MFLLKFGMSVTFTFMKALSLLVGMLMYVSDTEMTPSRALIILLLIMMGLFDFSFFYGKDQ